MVSWFGSKHVSKRALVYGVAAGIFLGGVVGYSSVALWYGLFAANTYDLQDYVLRIDKGIWVPLPFKTQSTDRGMQREFREILTRYQLIVVELAADPRLGPFAQKSLDTADTTIANGRVFFSSRVSANWVSYYQQERKIRIHIIKSYGKLGLEEAAGIIRGIVFMKADDSRQD